MVAVNTITDQLLYKVKLQGLSDESVKRKEFNDFFTRFEEHNRSSGLFGLKSSLKFNKTAVIGKTKCN